MSLCPNTNGGQCCCQPQDGVMCPYGPTPDDWKPWKEEAPAASERPLPTLPESDATDNGDVFGHEPTTLYTAEMMHAYVLADRAASAPQVHFDMERMERALASPRAQLPSGLTPEQKLEFMLSSAPQAVRMQPKPLSECREEDLTNHHALVYGRARVWYRAPTDSAEFQWHWSRRAWWKAMWYPHRGRPSDAGAWGIYGGSDGITGPGDADVTHFLPLPPEPIADGIVPLAPQDSAKEGT